MAAFLFTKNGKGGIARKTYLNMSAVACPPSVEV
jgi:hypothetical protein